LTASFLLNHFLLLLFNFWDQKAYEKLAFKHSQNASDEPSCQGQLINYKGKDEEVFNQYYSVWISAPSFDIMVAMGH
jgi:hypothetical protein